MSESRILLIDGDDGRAERVVTLLEFMDFNPRWVSECGDVSKNRRASDWIAITVGRIEDDDAEATAFFGALARDSAAPPILLLDGDAGAFSARFGVHAANVWPLDTPLKHAQLEHLLRRASLRRLEQEQQAASADNADDGPTGTSPGRRATTARSSPSTAARFRPICWKANCSATKKAHSPAHWPRARAVLNWPKAARCCWMKSAT